MMKRQEKKLISLNNELEDKNKQLEYTASHDALTSIYNRRHFDELLQREIAYERRYKTRTGFLMLDIDHFKSVNDTYGHNMGDEILVEFSRIVQKTLREVDVFGRWGGEEFVLFLPHTTQEGTMLVAQKICNAVANHSFPHKKTLTTSIGVVMLNHTTPLNQIFIHLDEALYEAKQNGRNCVVYKKILIEEKEPLLTT
jgi:diguanylate cyclase (GGDEF)-like protein